MATFNYKRDAVRIKALKYDGGYMPDTRKFSVDPQITSFEVLRSILAKAFDIKSDFAICYRVLDDYGQETYLPLLSDWDLDAAFVSAGEPCLCLRVEMKIIEEIGQEWEGTNNSFSWITDSKIPLRLQGLIMNHVEKTVNIVRGALNFIEEVQPAQEVSSLPPRNPLTDAEFRQFLDPVGQLVYSQEFKNAIYLGGVEPSLRKVVWKHLLNVYPDGLSGKQRIEYMKTKSYEYEQLRDTWRNLRTSERLEDLAYVTNMVKKDVLRTDRHHGYYAGSDENQNVVSLFNILTTYALNHPSVNYCQGMSDLASPLLVTMGDEAHAYICFCALMQRLAPNFLMDGTAMTKRFQHLADGLLYYDPTFYAYLKTHQADDLLFCYRWLLLEMKREFAFEDALRMLEVMWSSLPPTPAPKDLPLYEIKFGAQSNFPPPTPSPRETPYTKVCALRRQTSSGKALFKINRSLDESLIAKRRFISKLHSKVKQYSSLDDDALVRSKVPPSFSSDKNLSSSISDGSSSALSTSSCSDNSSVASVKHPDNPSSSSDIKKSDDDGNSHIVRMGSLNLKSSTSGRKVKNFNEFLSLDRKNISKHKLNRKIPEDVQNDRTERAAQNEKKSLPSLSPDDSEEYYPMTTSMTRELTRELENLDKRVFGEVSNGASSAETLTETDLNGSALSDCVEADVLNDYANSSNGNNNSNKNEDVFVWENPLQQYHVVTCSDLAVNDKCNGILEYVDSSYCSDNKNESKNKERKNASNNSNNNNNSNGNKNYSDCDLSSLISRRNRTLPPPWEFGGGNPFLMYLCITVLCQHRDVIMKTSMDYNEIAMHFDKMVRKHNVTRVLNQARIMYGNYLRQYKQNYLNV